jgi:hypothetical protein
VTNTTYKVCSDDRDILTMVQVPRSSPVPRCTAGRWTVQSQACFSSRSPSPWRIFDARASAEWLPISCMRSYTSLRRAPPASASNSSSSSSGDWPFACGGVAASPLPLPLAAAAPSGTAAPPASCKSPASALPRTRGRQRHMDMYMQSRACFHNKPQQQRLHARPTADGTLPFKT